MYPGTKPQATDEAKLMAESLRIFNSRFDGLKLRPGQTRWGENFPAEWAGLAAISKHSGQLPECSARPPSPRTGSSTRRTASTGPPW
jgi:hypothetical protein